MAPGAQRDSVFERKEMNGTLNQEEKIMVPLFSPSLSYWCVSLRSNPARRYRNKVRPRKIKHKSGDSNKKKNYKPVLFLLQSVSVLVGFNSAQPRDTSENLS